MLTGAWLQQRDGTGVPHDVCLPGVITPFQSQHVAVAGEDDGLPPPAIRFLGDHQVADRNVVPGGWQTWGRLIGADLPASDCSASPGTG